MKDLKATEAENKWLQKELEESKQNNVEQKLKDDAKTEILMMVHKELEESKAQNQQLQKALEEEQKSNNAKDAEILELRQGLEEAKKNLLRTHTTAVSSVGGANWLSSTPMRAPARLLGSRNCV